MDDVEARGSRRRTLAEALEIGAQRDMRCRFVSLRPGKMSAVRERICDMARAGRSFAPHDDLVVLAGCEHTAIGRRSHGPQLAIVVAEKDLERCKEIEQQTMPMKITRCRCVCRQRA